ncbi:MAG: hypothetical protein J4F36_14240 [Nitrosopumilaceae archaeon]|nr:hypothetical protein [Nitrosopumilaceae archaeon]
MIFEDLNKIPICSMLYMIYLPWFFGSIFWAEKREIASYNFCSSYKMDYYIIFAKNIIIILVTILLFLPFWIIDLFINSINSMEFLIKPLLLFILCLPCFLLTGNFLATSIIPYRWPILAMILQIFFLINIMFFYVWLGTKIDEIQLALMGIGFGMPIWFLFSVPISASRFQKNKPIILEILS